MEYRINGEYTLGDVHGWAPGLANYLHKHQLADITLNDIPFSHGANKIFPDVDELAVKGGLWKGNGLTAILSLRFIQIIGKTHIEAL